MKSQNNKLENVSIPELFTQFLEIAKVNRYFVKNDIEFMRNFNILTKLINQKISNLTNENHVLFNDIQSMKTSLETNNGNESKKWKEKYAELQDLYLKLKDDFEKLKKGSNENKTKNKDVLNLISFDPETLY